MSQIMNKQVSKQTIESAVQRFLWAIIAQRRISENTQQAYMHDLKVFTEFYIVYPGKNLLQDFYSFMKNTNTAAQTIARRLSSTMQFMKFCNQENLMKFDLDDKPKVKVSKTYAPFLETEDLEKMRSVLTSQKQDIRLRAIIEMLYSTGMRISELLGMKVSDLDSMRKDKYVLIKGKGGHERAVFFNEACIKAVEDYLLIEIPGEFVFASRRNQLTRQRVFQLLKDLAMRAGVDASRVSAHAFRHRMLTDLVKGDVDLITVQKIAGHRQIGTTSRYTHVEDHLYEDIVAKHPLGKG